MASDNGGNYDTPKLPEDLLMEIFLRSSVESLLRAKCVCKYWYGLIEDPSFAYKHLEYQKKRKRFRFLLQYIYLETRKCNYAILDDISQSSTTYWNLGYLHLDGYCLNMEGPVDGLYCLFDASERILLWNPALMDFKTLPLPPHHYLPHYKVAFGFVGFGKDPVTNDYKVVITRRFCNKLDNGALDDNLFASVYNIRTNTWRNLDLGDLGDLNFYNNFSSSFLGGSYHWWAVSGVVLAFDMGNETFRVIPGPDSSQFDSADYLACDLTVYEERVALMCICGMSVSIWVMLEEGFWIKQYSIGPFSGLMWPLGFAEKGGIFLVINDTETESFNPNSKMVLYDIHTHEMKNVGPRATDCGFFICVYYESLISISGRTSCKEKLNRWRRVTKFFYNRPSLSCNEHREIKAYVFFLYWRFLIIHRFRQKFFRGKKRLLFFMIKGKSKRYACTNITI